MPSCIYVELAVRQHPRTQTILERHPQIPVIEIQHHGEVFNPQAQNFRLQKTNPALIIAHKHHRRVLTAPAEYGLGGRYNYYFSHMLNCLYDCRYCFLQGMYHSAHHLIFVNYEDFADDITTTASNHPREPVWFFSGYDCDSLATEPLSHFASHFVPLFSTIENAWLELRTKSTQIRQLLELQPCERIITAFSFTDQYSHHKLEHGVPSIDKRIQAMKKLSHAGWPIGLRFDPLVYHQHYAQSFKALLEQLFSQVDAKRIHSVSLGTFRLPKDHFKRVSRLYPEEPLFAQNLEPVDGMVSYPLALEQEMIENCQTELLQHIPYEIYHPCQ